MSEYEQELPAAPDSERIILGSLLDNNDLFFDDLADLNADHFYLDSHKRIFRAINEIMGGFIEGVTHVDIGTLANLLSNRKEVSSVGGVAYLASLTEGLPRMKTISSHVHIVQGKAALRSLMMLGQNLMRDCGDQSTEPALLIERAQDHLLKMTSEGLQSAHIGDFIHGVADEIMSKRNENLGDTAADMSWGINAVDRFTGGIFGGEMTVMAADSGGFKTAGMMQVIAANALAGKACHVFSMEMSKEQLGKRMFPIISSILRAKVIRDPRKMDQYDVAEMKGVANKIAQLPITIDDTSPLTLPKMVARMKMHRRKNRVRLFAADYVQLITYPGKIGVEEVKGVMFGMRDFVRKEKDCHLLVLSQFAKQQGNSKGKRSKQDLYGGAVVHQAAQNVVRLSVSKPDEKEPEEYLDAEWDFEKQREGSPGRVKLRVDPGHLKFIEQQQESENGSSSGVTGRGKDNAAGK